MKENPYDFTAVRPPVLTERALRDKLSERERRRQAFTLVLAAFLLELGLVLLAAALYGLSPVLSLLVLGYALCLPVGGGIAAICMEIRRREERWQMSQGS